MIEYEKNTMLYPVVQDYTLTFKKQTCIYKRALISPDLQHVSSVMTNK